MVSLLATKCESSMKKINLKNLKINHNSKDNTQSHSFEQDSENDTVDPLERDHLLKELSILSQKSE